jgi:biotin operon repressor
MKRHTKNNKEKILAALKSGKPVTLSRLTALTNSTKVSTRISELRADGYHIENKLTYGKKHTFLKSTYQLIA